MKRWHEDISKMKHRVRECGRWGNNGYIAPKNTKLGRFRKRHPFDCGRAKCGICHFDKKYDIPTHKDVRDDFDRNEQFKDYL